MENNLIKYESNLGNFKSNIDISFSASNIIAITGLSGSGKSTIAKVICGLLKPVNGYIKINNKILYCSIHSHRETSATPSLAARSPARVCSFATSLVSEATLTLATSSFARVSCSIERVDIEFHSDLPADNFRDFRQLARAISRLNRRQFFQQKLPNTNFAGF